MEVNCLVLTFLNTVKYLFKEEHVVKISLTFFKPFCVSSTPIMISSCIFINNYLNFNMCERKYLTLYWSQKRVVTKDAFTAAVGYVNTKYLHSLLEQRTIRFLLLNHSHFWITLNFIRLWTSAAMHQIYRFT